MIQLLFAVAPVRQWHWTYSSVSSSIRGFKCSSTGDSSSTEFLIYTSPVAFGVIWSLYRDAPCLSTALVGWGDMDGGTKLTILEQNPTIVPSSTEMVLLIGILPSRSRALVGGNWKVRSRFV